jgi:glycerate kinase
MKKIIVATDSFKGTLSARQACRVIAEEAAAVFPEAQVLSVPIADGGEGLVDALLASFRGERVGVWTFDPLGSRLRAEYALLEGGAALIEMAAAGGLPLLAENERDPMRTSTFGVGRLILDAVQRGADPIYVGLGGSATNDGGAGAAAALGLRFENGVGQAVTTGGGLREIERIDRLAFDRLGLDGKLIFLVDVKNPLCGPNGAAAVFGPQKGASPEQVRVLDLGLRHLAGVIENAVGHDFSELEGIGAAGGFALPFAAFAGARIVGGIDFVLDRLAFDQKLEQTDLVISGEGRTDAQSTMGKAISEVARRAKRAGAHVAVISGLLGEGAEALKEFGVDDLVQAAPPGQALAEALARAEANLRAASRAYLEGLKSSRASG